MTVIVTDAGFEQDDWDAGFASADQRMAEQGLDLPSTTDPVDIDFTGVAAIRVNFPSSADGRGFTIARLLRLKGFKGRLRAQGHVLADQYAMARRAGFDEIEISDDLAARQPQDQWIFRADWAAHDYQSRLRR